MRRPSRHLTNACSLTAELVMARFERFVSFGCR